VCAVLKHALTLPLFDSFNLTPLASGCSPEERETASLGYDRVARSRIFNSRGRGLLRFIVSQVVLRKLAHDCLSYWRRRPLTS
jgi:hypothetical protein